jgi:peptidoglycan/LPS O-acetylase OafA/YrhL
MYCPAALIYLAGLLHSFSFMKTDRGEMFTARNLAYYWAKKIFRFLPLVVVTLLVALFIVPLIGSGPVWESYEQAIEPCRTAWWTNLLFVNNILPDPTNGSYDDKCMPWAWFIPVIV